MLTYLELEVSVDIRHWQSCIQFLPQFQSALSRQDSEFLPVISRQEIEFLPVINRLEIEFLTVTKRQSAESLTYKLEYM